MSDRGCPRQSILLTEGGGAVRRFKIERMIREGTSCVCYEAYHDNSGMGVLKEFYPRDADAPERNGEGQLVCPPGNGERRVRFLKAEKEFAGVYESLLAARRKAEDRDLATFIPPFEIYHGCDEKGNVIGTTYIWTPDRELVTFESLCGDIHAHPVQNPERKLFTVLSAAVSLVRCVCALHCAGMLHRDIKPSNFGFVLRDDEALTQTLSMFDMDTVCSVFGNTGEKVGTVGYMEPEAGYMPAANQTDIYSIGATLFHALIVTEGAEKNGYLFCPGDLDALGDMVDGSALIRASEANSHPKLRFLLTRILKKCLCARQQRYRNCEDLLDDLKQALFFALPPNTAVGRPNGYRWVLTDVERSLDAKKNKNSFLAIRYHLYEHPLFRFCPRDADTLRVLIVGFGNYGQKFMDACLEIGQMSGRGIRVTAVSDDETDREIYLSERPELAEYFDVGPSPSGKSDPWGTVVFGTARFDRDGAGMNKETAERLFALGGKPHYVFVALGDDGLNLAAAEACRAAAGKAECVVSRVLEGESSPVPDTPGFCAVRVREDVRNHPMHAEIERMAFNTHLVWEKDMNVDLRTLRRAFLKPYCHDSCVSTVLALKYKLFDLGIEPDGITPAEAARRAEGILSGEQGRDARNKMIWIEHRRWVTEKLCGGWRGIRDLKECVNGATKDEKRKRHVCIRRSRPDQMLRDEFSSKCPEKWDTASESELARLDELDRMSVELYRLCRKKAEELKKSPLSVSAPAGIGELAGGDGKAFAAWLEWSACLKDIMHGDSSKVRLSRGLKNAFLKAAEALPEERRKAIGDRVKAFETVFYPVIAGAERRDWKQIDTALVDSIPFVLTYSLDTVLAVPFAFGSSDRVFAGVSAATVINPAEVLFLCLARNAGELRDLKTAAGQTAEYMRRKCLRASVEYVVARVETEAGYEGGDAADIRSADPDRIRSVRIIPAKNTSDAVRGLGDFLRRRAAHGVSLAAVRNGTELSDRLIAGGAFHDIASFEADPAGTAFRAGTGCDAVRYITKKPFVTVSDLAAFGLNGRSEPQPEFYDCHRKLWNRYREDRALWKTFCAALRDHTEKNAVLASFAPSAGRKNGKTSREIAYILPAACANTAGKILEGLMKCGVIGKESQVLGHMTDSCEVRVRDRLGCRNGFDGLFSRVYALMDPEAVSVISRPEGGAEVRFDSLTVDGAQMPAEALPGIIPLTEFFRDLKYVIAPVCGADGKISFTCASRQVKKLLTDPDRILNIHVFHECRALGAFDDAVSGFETFEGGRLDCVLTRGFRTLFVICGAAGKEDRRSLARLRDRYGINGAAVLVCDTPAEDGEEKDGVITIRDIGEIDDIGRTLKEIIG